MIDPADETVIGHIPQGDAVDVDAAVDAASAAAPGWAAPSILERVRVAAPFDTYEEAVAEAKSLPCGLTASVWTTSLRTAMAAARDLRTGCLWVNESADHLPGAAFGGVKNSGIGREEDIGELVEYTQAKNVYLRF